MCFLVLSLGLFCSFSDDSRKTKQNNEKHSISPCNVLMLNSKKNKTKSLEQNLTNITTIYIHTNYKNKTITTSSFFHSNMLLSHYTHSQQCQSSGCFNQHESFSSLSSSSSVIILVKSGEALGFEAGPRLPFLAGTRRPPTRREGTRGGLEGAGGDAGSMFD